MHEKKVKNAKPTIRIRFSESAEKLPQIKTGASAFKTKPSPASAKDTISGTAIYKLLKAFKLQQYARVSSVVKWTEIHRPRL